VVLKSVEKRAARSELRADGVCVHVNFAHVVFKDAAAVEKALDAATGRIASSLVLPPPAGELRERLRGNLDAYRDPTELRREVDAFMTEYDEREGEKRRIARETAVDEDGFTKVVSGITRTADGLAIRAAKRPDLKTGAFAEPIKSVQASTGPGCESIVGAGEGPRKKKKKREQPDFYRFQVREKKLQEVVDHRKRRIEDTETIEYMKKKKKFKDNMIL
jgi:ribosomal RNA-processing protein 7